MRQEASAADGVLGNMATLPCITTSLAACVLDSLQLVNMALIIDSYSSLFGC